MVRCRSVPPLAPQGAMNRPELWYPPPPKIKVKTVAGEELVDAPDGSPEMVEYLRKSWEVSQLREQYGSEFAYAYGVVEWSDDEGKTWNKDVPKDWEIDPIIKEYMSFAPTSRRAAFVLYELMKSANDLMKLNRAIYVTEETPVTGEEVQSAEDSFLDSVSGEESEGVGE